MHPEKVICQKLLKISSVEEEIFRKFCEEKVLGHFGIFLKIRKKRLKILKKVIETQEWSWVCPYSTALSTGLTHM